LTAETKYGGTVTNVKRKWVPDGGSSYSKTTRAKACTVTWDSQQTTVWWTKSTRRNVLCKVKIGRLSSTDSFVLLVILR